MRPMTRHASRKGALLIWTLALGAPSLEAQEPSASWTPANVGIRFGWDGRSNGSVLGAHLRVPVLPNGRIELMGGADRTFLQGTHDDQLNLDVVGVLGGRSGGLYAGGGLGWRNGIFTPGAGRETVTSRGLVVGLQQAGVVGIAGIQLEFRWIFPSEVLFDPQPATLGLNLPLWGWSEIRDLRGR